jgi:hypothetical protein
MAQFPGKLRPHLSGSRRYCVKVVESLNDAPRNQSAGRVLSERGFEPWAPAQQGKLHL